MSAKPLLYVKHTHTLLNIDMLYLILIISQSGILPVRNDYVECECYRLGEFAVVNDVERGFGWTLSAGLVAAFIVVSHIISKCQVVVKRLLG